jgi:hypothetical protein
MDMKMQDDSEDGHGVATGTNIICRLAEEQMD